MRGTLSRWRGGAAYLALCGAISALVYAALAVRQRLLETSGYGVNNCFIFRPDAATLGSYQVGDVFDVSLSGGITLKATGAPATIAYRTELMSQVAVTPPATDVTPPETSSDAQDSYAMSATIHLSASDGPDGSGVASTPASLRIAFQPGPNGWVFL